MRSLKSALEEFPDYKDSRLIKIDTDGHDAKIVISSIDLLSKMKPVLFVEYYPIGDLEAAIECRKMLRALAEVGYSHFHVFDNFGDHMLRLPASQRDHMKSLNSYVRATQRSVRPALFYYDICAFPSDEQDLSDKLLKRYTVDG
jgi:hypothetical protein